MLYLDPEKVLNQDQGKFLIQDPENNQRFGEGSDTESKEGSVPGTGEEAVSGPGEGSETGSGERSNLSLVTHGSSQVNNPREKRLLQNIT